MALLIYLPPILVIQYNIILIILNSIYIILLFVNKQWGYTYGELDTTQYKVNYNIAFPKTSVMMIFPNSGQNKPVYYTGLWNAPGQYNFQVIFNSGCQYLYWFAIGY